MSRAFKVAIVRATISGVVMGGSAFFAQLATGGSVRAAEIAAGVAFFGILIIRGGGEGFIDTQADSSGSAMPPKVG